MSSYFLKNNFIILITGVSKYSDSKYAAMYDMMVFPNTDVNYNKINGSFKMRKKQNEFIKKHTIMKGLSGSGVCNRIAGIVIKIGWIR